MGTSGKRLGRSLKPVGYEPNPNAAMSAGQVMFKLYTIFQPGGQVERTSLLQMLVDWKCPSNNAAEMVNSIRMWRRWVVRAEELQLVLPDPLVLAGGRKNG